MGGARAILVAGTSGAAMGTLVSGLGARGKLIVVAVPQDQIQLNAFPLVFGGRSIYGSLPGTPIDGEGGDSTQVKIARAMSAGPTEVAKAAKIVGADAKGKMLVLREGNNGFTCMPGNLKVVGEPPMCVDAPSMQRIADARAHKPKPTNTVPGIAYTLAGATQRSDSDPHDVTSMPIEAGPHWMIMWPFDPKATGLPTTHRPTGAYIMWAGSPYAHVHIMGHP